MSTSNKILAAAAGLALAAGAAAYGWRWRRNYQVVQWERDVRSSIPEEAGGGVDLTMEEIGEFEEIAEFTCLEPCCFEPEDDDVDIWADPDEL